MPEENPALRQRIEQFTIGDPHAEFPFAVRLAQENAWPTAFAERVIREYKRFVYLAMVAKHPVTPSDQVDQAWHLHLTYTRSYWQELCQQTLPRPLHHGPTRGGTAEAAKYEDWYVRTCQSYCQVFGEAPPVDIWPPVHLRFGRDLHFRRINTRQHWILPKPARTRVLRWAGLASLLLLGVVATIVPADRSLAADLSAAAMGGEEVVGLVVFGIGVVAVLAYRLIVGKRCPACGQRQAMARTGNSEKPGWFRARREEWQCRFCQHRQWKSSDSGGGCGGCGGCGG